MSGPLKSMASEVYALEDYAAYPSLNGSLSSSYNLFDCFGTGLEPSTGKTGSGY